MARGIDVVPLGVATMVGAVDGLIHVKPSNNVLIDHGHLLFDVAVLAGGTYGAMRNWHPDVSYGAQCAAAALLGSRLIPSAVLRSLDAPSTFTEIVSAAPAVAHPAIASQNGHAAGCSACAARARAGG